MALLHRRSTSKRASQKMWGNNAAMPDDASANDNVSSARPEPAAFVPTPFDEVIDISDLVAERRRLQRNLWAMRIITIVLLIAAIAVACFPLALQFESDRNLAATTATTAKEVAGWPYPQAEDKLTAARAYNKKLAESGQPILGEAVDPFAAAQGGSQASGEDSASKKDKEYQSLLNTGNGVMGTIKVPKQSMSVGVATVLDAKQVLILALGHKKARALQQCVEGPYSHVCTISAMQVHPHGIVVCDEPATVELKVGTYRYFKDIEKENLI